MPIWAYQISPLLLAVLMVFVIETCSLLGLILARRFLLPRFRFHDGVNDAISGTVQTIGVFYGITVGLIAVGVWNTNSNSSDLVSKEAAAIGALYRDVGGYPSPQREELRAKLRDYTVFTIEQAWPAQQEGRLLNGGTEILDQFQAQLYSFEPAGTGQIALHSETLSAFNKLIEYRRLRIDAVESGLSSVMWAVIWIGAAVSIAVAYFYRIEDPKLHGVLVFLMAGFLGIVLFMIVINDKPFFGSVSVSADPYRLILERLIQLSH
jgi:Protein of unknown function (DUF4239)